MNKVKIVLDAHGGVDAVSVTVGVKTTCQADMMI